jgi:hypothetical protein
MAFPQTHAAEEDDIGLFLDEGEAEEVLDLEPVDLFGPTPLELLKGFEHGEAGEPDMALDTTVLAQVSFAFEELLPRYARWDQPCSVASLASAWQCSRR